MAPHSVVYIDPPYVTNGHKLYRYHFEKEQHDDRGGDDRDEEHGLRQLP